MAPLRGLSLAIEQALRTRDLAVDALRGAQQAWQGAQDQMGQLQSYARETELRWALGSRETAQPEVVRHYDHFMDRLQQAVDLQQGVVADQARALDEARKRVTEAEIRAAGLQKLLDKRRMELARCQSVREQKQQDDMAALQFRRLQLRSQTMGTA